MLVRTKQDIAKLFDGSSIKSGLLNFLFLYFKITIAEPEEANCFLEKNMVSLEPHANSPVKKQL